jgi:2-iminobutanoate/2-iminopropanoate deaminase
MKIISTNKAPSAIGPYSQAIIANGFLFASGQIPLSPETGSIVEGGIAEQTEQVMQNIKAVLAAAGSDFSKIVKTTCFLTNMSDFAAFNEIYSKYFTGKPARSCVAVSALPRGAAVEVEIIAEICKKEI